MLATITDAQLEMILAFGLKVLVGIVVMFCVWQFCKADKR